MSATIPKRYEYKVSRNGTFLGILQDVQSEFTYNQLIGTAGAQLNIEVSVSPDTASLPVSPILDETGAIITDEVGGSILEERSPDLVGDAADNILIRNDNDIEVYEFSSRHPNGVLVFKGYISKWKAIFGGPDDVQITVLSHGQDLSHYINQGGTADTLDQSQTQSDGDPSGDIGSWYTSTVTGDGQRYGQTFVVGAGITNLSAIVLKLATNYPSGTTLRTITMKIWNSVADANAGVTPRAEITQQINNTTLQDITFQLATPLSVTAGQTVFFSIDPDPSSTFSDVNGWLGFACKTSNVYSNGTLWRRNSGSAGYVNPFDYDMYFKTYYSANSTAKTYTNSDPSTTLTSLMDYYRAAGGAIAKQSGGYSLTGVTPAQTVFKVNTILEAIQKLITLAPSDWYWYVDPAADTLYFKQTATTATHRLIKGRHIELLELEATKEDITNIVYFTGGATAGVNLFVNVNDNASLVANRRGIARLTDNRITDTSTGQLIAQNYINQHDEQKYITQVTVNEATYDITLFNLGEIVGFEGFGTLVDNLLLQIVGITRNVDSIVLSLGVLPPRATALTQQLNRELADVQTIDNPSTPS